MNLLLVMLLAMSPPPPPPPHCERCGRKKIKVGPEQFACSLEPGKCRPVAPWEACKHWKGRECPLEACRFEKECMESGPLPAEVPEGGGCQ